MTLGNEARVAGTDREGGQGCLREVAWLGAGLVLPCGSLTFYRRAARRKVGLAVLFFALFALLVSTLATAGVAGALLSTSSDVRQAFESGEVPVIVIEDGVARVDADGPIVLLDERGMIIVIDVTGEYEALDPSTHEQGFLLTRTSLHVMNDDGRYQEISLSDLHQMLGRNPIVIDGDSVAGAWTTFSAVFTVLVFGASLAWNGLVDLAYLAVLALVIWGLVSLFRSNTGFGSILTTGLYALVPATYLHYLFGLVGIRFLTLQTLLLLPIWAAALAVVLMEPSGGLLRGERPMRLWRALIGLPARIVLCLDLIGVLPHRAVVAWAAAAVSLIAFIAAGLLTAGTLTMSGGGTDVTAGPAPAA